MGEKPKFVSAQYLAGKTGMTDRWIRDMAAEGRIPGAHKPGGHWRFDEARFWRWWGSSERKLLWRPSIKGATSSGAGSRVKAVNTGSRLRQLVGL